MINIKWNEEESEKLTVLWDKGYSASYIGAVLKKSRNAIIGKINRLKEKGYISQKAPRAKRSISATVKKEKPPTKIARIPKKTEVIVKIKPKLEPKKLPENPFIVLGVKPVKFSKLKRNKCKYVINDGHPSDYLFCNADTDTGKPFCDYHHSICYTRAYKNEQPTERRPFRLSRY
jgi:GcrA cell cycle regulator